MKNTVFTPLCKPASRQKCQDSEEFIIYYQSVIQLGAKMQELHCINKSVNYQVCKPD